MGKRVFLSYAREDWETAERLYHDLSRRGYSPWLDTKNLLPGEQFRTVIKQTILRTDVILILISSKSVTKRGFFQAEIKQALAAYDEVPPGNIFLIPVRLDNTRPRHKDLSELQWVDLFPDYDEALGKIIKAIEIDQPRRNGQHHDTAVIKTNQTRESGHKRGSGRRGGMNRARVYSYLIALGVTVIILTAAAIKFSWPEDETLYDSEYEKVAKTVTGSKISQCKAEPKGSSVQLFTKGWLVQRVASHTYYSISKDPEGTLSWMKVNRAEIHQSPENCEQFHKNHLLAGGFRRWCCSSDSTELHDLLGEPIWQEVVIWVQFQDWTGGILIYGLPETAGELEEPRFLNMHALFLNGEKDHDKGIGNWVRFTKANFEKEARCTSLWYPVVRGGDGYGVRKLPPQLRDSPDCLEVIEPDVYIRPMDRCSLDGYPH